MDDTRGIISIIKEKKIYFSSLLAYCGKKIMQLRHMLHADLKQVFPSLQQNSFKTGDALLSKRMSKDLVCNSAYVELLHYSNQIYFSLRITILP